MVHTPGWIVLSQKVAQIAGLTVIDRLLEQPNRKPPRIAAATPPAPAPETAPPVPQFITEVADNEAGRYRIRTGAQSFLFAGFFSDGRVRLATSDGKRYSGVMVNETAVMADLRDDISFELSVSERAGEPMTITMDGGPFANEHLICEKLS